MRVVSGCPREGQLRAGVYELRNQFDQLLVYLDDGLMPIENNETEQLMKQVAIGRAQWLFIGDDEPSYYREHDVVYVDRCSCMYVVA